MKRKMKIAEMNLQMSRGKIKGQVQLSRVTPARFTRGCLTASLHVLFCFRKYLKEKFFISDVLQNLP